MFSLHKTGNRADQVSEICQYHHYLLIQHIAPLSAMWSNMTYAAPLYKDFFTICRGKNEVFIHALIV